MHVYAFLDRPLLQIHSSANNGISWHHQLIQNMLDSSFNGGPRKTTSSKLQSGDGNNKDGKSAFLCPCHLFTNDFMGVMYTAHQQWRWVAQRLQWSFARGNIMGHGQQQNREQRNSDLYVVAISTRAHSSAVMGAFNCPCIYHLSSECHGVLDQCAMWHHLHVVLLLWKVVYSCSPRSIHSHCVYTAIKCLSF